MCQRKDFKKYFHLRDLVKRFETNIVLQIIESAIRGASNVLHESEDKEGEDEESDPRESENEDCEEGV